jgi:hypothetical protein
MELLLDRLGKSKNNDDFLGNLQDAPSGGGGRSR